MRLKCLRCNYEWKSKVDNPKQCPKCKQYYYNKQAGWEYLENKVEVKEEPKEIKQEEVKDESKDEVSFY